MLSQSQIAKHDKSTWAKRWASMKNRLANMREEAEHSVEKAGMAGTSTFSFAAMYYGRRRLQYAGKRVTFDKAGNVDAFLWPGLAAAIVGITPVLGEAGKYVAILGSSAVNVGLTGVIDDMARKHAGVPAGPGDPGVGFKPGGG